MNKIANKNHLLFNQYWVLDYIIVPIFIIVLAYQPNFIHGFIDHLESGKDLACLNELFLGKVIYKDTLPLVGFLNTYFQFFLMSLFGKTIGVLRGYFYFGTIFTLIVGYIISLRLSKARLIAYATAMLLVIETYHPFWATRWGGLRFGIGLIAILCAIMYFTKDKKPWAFFAGLFSAVALLVSVDIGILCLVAISFSFCACYLYNFFQKKASGVCGFLSFITGLSILGTFFAIFLICNGAFLSYVNTIYVIATNHLKVWGQSGAGINFPTHISDVKVFSLGFKQLFPLIIYASCSIYLLYQILTKQLTKRHYGILCLFIYGMLMYAASFRAVLGSQFQMAFQPAIIIWLVLIGDIASYILSNKRKDTIMNLIRFSAGASIIMLSLYYVIFSEKLFYGDSKGWVLYQRYKKHVMPFYKTPIPLARLKLADLDICRARGIRVPLMQLEEIENVTKYIISVTKPGEVVFTFPEHGIYNFLADRPCMDRFGIAGLAWTCSEWRKELFVDLKNAKPLYVIYGKRLSNLAMSIGRTEELLPEIIEYLSKNYAEEASFGDIAVLRKNTRF
jgi:hypothetical protein